MTPNEQARAALVEILMDKAREDPYPSTTQLQIIEETLPRELAPQYIELLLDKVRDDQYPSIPMLQRIQRVTDELL